MGTLMNRLIYVVAKAPNWMLSLIPQGKDVLAVEIQDNSGVLTKDSTGHSKGIVFKKDKLFTFIKFPVNVSLTEKETLEGLTYLLKAKLMAAKLSPVYIEKRFNRKTGNGTYERTNRLWNESSIYVDVDSLAPIRPTYIISSSKKSSIEEVVEQPGDDKLTAYQELGFIDVGNTPTQQSYSLPTDDQLVDSYIESTMYDEQDEEDFDEYYTETKSVKSKKSKMEE